MRRLVACVGVLMASVLSGGCFSLDLGLDLEGSTQFEHGAVAADHVIASEAGAQMLRLGGNAVDAAVATSFTLAVVRPYSCGIGGGGFMVIHLPDEPTHGAVTTAIDYRETAPGVVGPDFYADGSRSSTRGGTAAGVPGTVAGLLHALDEYGTLDRSVVMGPAIKAAEEGFAADENYVKSSQALIEEFESNPTMRARFGFVWTTYLHEGQLAVGDVITNPAQARALRLISLGGADVFYKGAIADAIVSAMASDTGVMTREDLEAYDVAEVEPLRFRIGGVDTPVGRTAEYELITMPPPSSGGVAIAETFGILDRVGFPGLLAPDEATGDGIEDVAAWARRVAPMIEAFKLAFADRAEWLGDPAYVQVPVVWLLSDAHLEAMASKVRRGEGAPVPKSTDAPPDDSGTSHFCVVDRWDGIVSCTETINLEFGSLLAVDDYGFVLNDEMDDFTARPGEPNSFGLIQSAMNSPAPGKRPLSSMSPTIVLDAEGKVYAAVGASGGPRIITSTTEVLSMLTGLVDPSATAPGLRSLYWMYTPRFHHQWLPDAVYVETWWGGGPKDESEADSQGVVQRQLEAMGYEVRTREDIGNVQLIVRGDAGRWEAACDPRKGGRPAGY
jgi:gamma-glutamyltranspeptidase / glutathione hydrolase